MTRRIDLNADLGEGVTDDAALLEVVTSANVACGFHAGDSVTMRIVCRMAVERRVAIGAQVSHDDREGFGRRDVDVPPRVLREHVAEQVGLLCGSRCRRARRRLRQAARRPLQPGGARPRAGGGGAAGVGRAARAGAARLGAAGDGGRLGREARREGFPDRAYTPEGRLRRARSRVAFGCRRARDRAARGGARGRGRQGCVHGDEPRAVRHARVGPRRSEESGFELRPW